MQLSNSPAIETESQMVNSNVLNQQGWKVDYSFRWSWETLPRSKLEEELVISHNTPIQHINALRQISKWLKWALLERGVVSRTHRNRSSICSSMGMVTTWPGDWITLNEHVNRWCHGISRLTLNQSMGSKLTAAWSVTSQSVSQAHLTIWRSYQGLPLFFASKWLFNDTQPWSQCLGCWNQNVWGSREVIEQGVVRVSQCMGSYRGCIGSWGVVSGSRLEDCPQALAWSPRWPINCRQWLRQSASCDLGPTTCQIIWQTVTLWWANTSPRPTSNRANLWPGGDKNFPSQLTLLYPMNSAFVPLDCKNLSRDKDWKWSPSSNLKHKEVDLVAENPPHCIQLWANLIILRTFLTEPAGASDRVDFEYCEPFWRCPVSRPSKAPPWPQSNTSNGRPLRAGTSSRGQIQKKYAGNEIQMLSKSKNWMPLGSLNYSQQGRDHGRWAVIWISVKWYLPWSSLMDHVWYLIMQS